MLKISSIKTVRKNSIPLNACYRTICSQARRSSLLLRVHPLCDMLTFFANEITKRASRTERIKESSTLLCSSCTLSHFPHRLNITGRNWYWVQSREADCGSHIAEHWTWPNRPSSWQVRWYREDAYPINRQFFLKKEKKGRKKEEPWGLVRDQMTIRHHFEILCDKNLPISNKNECSKRVIELLGRFSRYPPTIPFYFRACRDGNYINGDLFEALTGKLVNKIGLKNCKSGHLALIFNCLATLAMSNDQYKKMFPSYGLLMDGLINELHDRHYMEYNECNMIEISKIFVSMGFVFGTDSPVGMTDSDKRLLEILIGKITPKRMQKCSVRGLISFMNGFTMLGIEDKEKIDVLCGKLRGLVRKHVKMFVKEIVDLVCAVDALGIQEEYTLNALGEIILRKPHKFHAPDLVKIVNAFGKLGYADDWVLDALTTEIVKESKLGCMSANDLVIMIKAFGMLKVSVHRYGRCLRLVVRSLCTTEKLGECSENDLCGVVHALGALKLSKDFVGVGMLGKEVTKRTALFLFSEDQLEVIEKAFKSMKVGHERVSVIEDGECINVGKKGPIETHDVDMRM